MYGIPISFTVLKGHDYVEGLLERDELVNVQLPQKFDRAKLLAAHEAARRRRRRTSPRTPACSSTTPASRSGSSRAPTRTSRSRSRPTPSWPRRSTPTSSGAGPDRWARPVSITGASQGIGRAAAIRMAREPDVDDHRPRRPQRERARGDAPPPMDAGDQTVTLIPYDLGDLDGIPDLVARHPRRVRPHRRPAQHRRLRRAEVAPRHDRRTTSSRRSRSTSSRCCC